MNIMDQGLHVVGYLTKPTGNQCKAQKRKKERKIPPFPRVRQLGSNMAPFPLSGLTAHPGC